MVTLEIARCKTCGVVLDDLIRTAENGVVTCPACANVWTIARKDATPDTRNFLQIGEHDLDVGKYDDAFVAYQKAAELDPKEPEAYFGMALAEFKIRYLKDHTANRLQPICGEITDKRFKDGNSYLRALLNATDAQRSEYEKRAEEIDYILGEFYKLKQAGKRYDCFICVKVTDDETKLPTEDSKDADYIYRLLQEKGFTPFYSERELRNETGADYEARILYALYTSECMLVVCHNADYLQTPWVKNEYTRFLKLVNDEEKESDSITIVFNGKPIEKLPGRAGKIQGINFVLREADEKVVKFVDAHTPEGKRRREEEKQKRIEQEKIILRQIEEQKKQQRELEEKLQNIQGGSGFQATATSLLTRASQELSSEEYAKAEQFYDRVLEADPQNAEAWWGKFLVEMNLREDDRIWLTANLDTFKTIKKSRNYQNAMQYATDEFREHLNSVKDRIQKCASEQIPKLESSKEQKKQAIDKATAQHEELNRNLKQQLKVVKQELNTANQVLNDNSRKNISDDKISRAQSAIFDAGTHANIFAVVMGIAFFVLLTVLTRGMSEEAYRKLPVLITWNHFETRSFVAFLLRAAKAIVFTIAMKIVFFIFDRHRIKSKHMKLLTMKEEYKRMKATCLAKEDEIRQIQARIDRAKKEIDTTSERRSAEIKQLEDQIKLFGSFLPKETTNQTTQDNQPDIAEKGETKNGD